MVDWDWEFHLTVSVTRVVSDAGFSGRLIQGRASARKYEMARDVDEAIPLRPTPLADLEVHDI